MGCCQGKPGGLSKAQRATKWRSTGIVGLRDSNLKELPTEVVNIATSVRTLDATHNKLGWSSPSIPPRVILDNKYISASRFAYQVNGESSLRNIYKKTPVLMGRLSDKIILYMLDSCDEEIDYSIREQEEVEQRQRSLIARRAQGTRARSCRCLNVFGRRNLIKPGCNNNLCIAHIQVLKLGLSFKTRTISEEIGNFVNLQRLILAENWLERLPSTLGKLRSLKVLTLDSNRLSMLPDEVGLLERLEKLSLSDNNLKELPSTLGSLSNLIQLDVSDNRLETLPVSIGNCKSLEELIANDNMLNELPESVSSLSHLKTLVLSNQQLKQLPSLLLRDCKALQSLELHGTLISADQVHQMEGFEAYEQRRRRKHDKQLDANVMIGSRGFDEGVDL